MTPPPSHLVACPACARHVRASEATCPFCKGALDETTRSTPQRQGPSARLSRAALYAFGVGSLTAASACSSSSAVPMPPYGAAPQFDGSIFEVHDAASDLDSATASDDAGDAGTPKDAHADAIKDATPDAPFFPPDAVPAPPYGLPPPPPPPEDGK